MGSRKYFFLFSLLVIFSCSDNEFKDTDYTFWKIDITNAKGLFIGKNGTTTSGGRIAGTESEKIFKVTDEGLVIEVKITNEEGDTLEHYPQPSNIVNVNDDFVIIEFGEFQGYLVRKDDGAVFELSSDLPALQSTASYAGDYVTQDNTGNIYYINKSYELVKIDISNPAEIKRSTYSATGDGVYTYVLDPNANVVYIGNDAGNNSIIRYKKSGGQFELLPGSSSYPTYFWKDFAGNIYFYNESIVSQGYSRAIQMISSSPFGLSDYGNENIYMGCGFKAVLKVKNKNKIVAPTLCSNTAISQLYSHDGVIRNIPFSTFNLVSHKLSGASADYYYLSGITDQAKAVLLKIDPDTDEFTYLINGEYDLYKMVVSEFDEIIFNALRLADGKIVLGQISSEGEIEILEETLDEEVRVLERLN